MGQQYFLYANDEPQAGAPATSLKVTPPSNPLVLFNPSQPWIVSLTAAVFCTLYTCVREV